MNIRRFTLASIAVLGVCLSAHASEITFDVSSGTLTPSGSFSGSFLIDSTTEMIDGADITVTAPNGGTVYDFSSASNDSSIPGLALLSDGSGDMFALAVDGSLSDLAVNTFANFGLYDTFLMTQGGLRFDATGGTLTEITPVASTPEPSTLLLLGTGALGLAGSFRRRMLNA